MINFDDVTREILIVRGSISGKTNKLFNLTSQQPNIDKLYLYAKDPFKQNINFKLKNEKVQD